MQGKLIETQGKLIEMQGKLIETQGKVEKIPKKQIYKGKNPYFCYKIIVKADITQKKSEFKINK